MWRRTYLFLLLVRLYLALSPSYIHPDENLQGPEVIAGELFSYPAHRTWEWTSQNPVRSVFPLWPVYGIPMTLLQWVWAEDSQGRVSPKVIYYVLRLVMFFLSFVLEDWAVHELIQSPRHRLQTLILVASSYVTWVYQSHTFSNSIETILVAWSIVLIERIGREKDRSSVLSYSILGFLMVFGTFNRITFPAFILIPGLRLLPHLISRPFSILSLAASALLFTVVAVMTDTIFYLPVEATSTISSLVRSLLTKPVITPLNNLLYNTQTANLALHGLHPHYQHFLVNFPLLLGPALLLPFLHGPPKLSALLNPRPLSALTGALLLSFIPHQEPRFLLPAIPLILTSVRLPTFSPTNSHLKLFWGTWLLFNTLLGTLMGIYHQAGVVPAQLHIPAQIALDTAASPTSSISAATVFWWKTYPPPLYLLGHNTLNISTVTLMGATPLEVKNSLVTALTAEPCYRPKAATGANAALEKSLVYIVLPLSAPLLSSHAMEPSPTFTALPLPPGSGHDTVEGMLVWVNRRHVNLDDIDLPDDGVWGTLKRVVGRRGLGVWRVRKIC